MRVKMNIPNWRTYEYIFQDMLLAI